jgi:hypothetical protein
VSNTALLLKFGDSTTARRGYQRARGARGAWLTTILLKKKKKKLYGDFSCVFMVKNGSETPRHGEPWELGDG